MCDTTNLNGFKEKNYFHYITNVKTYNFSEKKSNKRQKKFSQLYCFNFLWNNFFGVQILVNKFWLFGFNFIEQLYVVLNSFKMSSTQTFFSCLFSKAMNAKLRIRSFVMDMRDGILTSANAENEASHTAVLHANVSIRAYNLYTSGNASRTSNNVDKD